MEESVSSAPGRSSAVIPGRAPPRRGARILACRAAIPGDIARHSMLSTPSKRNEAMAGLSRDSAVKRAEFDRCRPQNLEKADGIIYEVAATRRFTE